MEPDFEDHQAWHDWDEFIKKEVIYVEELKKIKDEYVKGIKAAIESATHDFIKLESELGRYGERKLLNNELCAMEFAFKIHFEYLKLKMETKIC